ncbi:MAG TPA: AMP-binding protein [Anaerolineae bacterium]|nr:AMP-binding protein [Anaerolineae bacterium]
MNMQIMLKLMNNLGELRKHEHWTRAQLEAYQAESLRRLREYAFARSPFYKRFHKGLLDRPLHELPVLTKARVMENFDELVTDRTIRLEDVRAHMANDSEGRRFLNRYWVTATSGSTGHPGVFLFNGDEWSAFLASFGRAHEWAGVPMIPTHRMKMASVAALTSGSPWHASAQMSASAKSWWMRAWMPILSFDAAQPLPEMVHQLNDWQPHLLTGYPSMMRILADEQLSGRLHIHPHMIIPGSEVLTEETRRRIEQAWGHPPFDGYGATEAGGWLAAETSDHSGLYVYEDNVIFEVVDEKYRPVPAGVYGDKVLITVLTSRTQPLIRYELSDRVRLATDPSDLGWPFARINGIQGRTEDILHLPTVSGGEAAVHPITFHHVLDSLPVNGWQVVQEMDGLRVLLSGGPDGTNDSMLVDALTRSLAAQNVSMPHISMEHVAAIPKNATGKTPLIKAYRAKSEVKL